MTNNTTASTIKNEILDETVEKTVSEEENKEAKSDTTCPDDVNDYVYIATTDKYASASVKLSVRNTQALFIRYKEL